MTEVRTALGPEPDLGARCATAVTRVLASRTFAKTARLSSFLGYACATSLAGQGKSLSEQNIGNHVFGRPEHYNPAEDTIVRTTARLLRQRLATYYDTEGRDDDIRIVIPRGTYVPLFVAADASPSCPPDTERPIEPPREELARPTPAAVTTTTSASEVARTPANPMAGSIGRALRLWAACKDWRKARPWAIGMGGMAVTLCAFALIPRPYSQPEPAQVFWRSLFTTDRDTLLIPADSALVMYEDEVHRQVDLDAYVANRITAPTDRTAGAADQASKFRARRYTAVISVMMAAELAKLSGAAQSRFHVRFSRDARLNDFKQSNTILVGVEQANPWVQLFRDRLNFHIDWDGAASKFIIRNDKPQAGEQREYEFLPSDATTQRGYAVIAYTRSLTGSGRALLVGGTGSAGTEAAAEFLLDPARLGDLLKRATAPDGSIGEFEALLQCSMKADGSTSVKLIGLRLSS